MRPTDSRLLHRVPRRVVLGLAVLAVVRAGAVVAQAYLLARLVVLGFAGSPGAELVVPAVGSAVAVLVRAAVAGTSDLLARRASVGVRRQVREELLGTAVRRGPAWLATPEGHELPTLVGPGVDQLDGYVGSFLPLLVQCAVVPPAVLAGVGVADLWSLLVLALCLPLLPLFLALVGMHTRRRTDAQLDGLTRMSERFLDVVVGLPTLRVFGRARRQVEVLRELAQEHRGRTLAVLRTAFLSALVLELLSTLSVALVAVSLGFRLLEGHIGFQAALTVLLLAPEAFLPLRSAGAAYHSAVGGLTASAAVERVLAGDARPGPQGDLAPVGTALRLDRVSVRQPGRSDDALRGLTLHVGAGETVVVTGPSGSGKSTLIGLLLGLVTPTEGRVLVGDVDLAAVDLDAWRSQVGWVPQRPHLFAGSIEDNIRLARPSATEAELQSAVEAARVSAFLPELPHGLATRVGDRGVGLSVGQVRRVALARAFLRDAPVMLLDEPTADLDVRSELAVVEALRALRPGRTVVITTHRAAPLLEGARHVDLGLVAA